MSMTSRLGGIAGVLYVILAAVGSGLLFDSPDNDAPDQEWLDYLKDDNKLVMNLVGGYMWIVAGMLFLVFLAVLYRKLHAAEGGDGVWSLVALVSGVVLVSSMVVLVAAVDAVPGGIKLGGSSTPTSPDVARMLPQMGFGAFLLGGGFGGALFAAVTSFLIMRTGMLPAFTAWLGFLAAIAMLAAAIFIPVIVFLLWVLVMGIMLFLRGDQATMTPG